ncbi:MAG: beta-galactosidase trimerization domain-containing protein [Polyangia bacterium]
METNLTKSRSLFSNRTMISSNSGGFLPIVLASCLLIDCTPSDLVSGDGKTAGAAAGDGAGPTSGSDGTGAPSAIAGWVQDARIAGASVRKDMTQAEIEQLMTALAAQNVSVIEADFEEGLSRYRSEAEFDLFLEPMRRLAAAAHGHGLKIVLYYASLEVETPNGETQPHTMAKDHPDWVQVGLGGTPNVVYGGKPSTHWIEPGMEDAWMSPNSPYKEVYYHQAAKIAATGFDGIWVDVPLYAAWNTVRWNDVSPYAAKKFQADTGYLAPNKEDWNDLAWRRWIAWRHQQLRDFLAGVAKATRPQPQSEFTVIVETLPTDYTGSTIWGLEGADLRSIDGVVSVYELSTLSVNSSMRLSREDDWISYISMQKFIKAASGSRPSWAFAYAQRPDDATLVAAEALAARNNVYELKQPEMSTTVDPAYRTNLFGWIKANQGPLFDSRPAARVALLYSQASRDYVDRAAALGQYVTINAADELWWDNDATASALTLQYVAEFRGLVKLLVHNHIPFDVVVKPASASELTRYQTVIWPDGEAVSDAEAQLLKSYVSGGGHLIVTGPNPAGWDEYGTPRPDYALSDVLGFKKGSALPSSKLQRSGTGEVHFFSDLLGKRYFMNASDGATAAAPLLQSIRATSEPWLSTSADRKVHIELSQGEDQLFLQYVNFIGLTGTFTVVPTSAATALKIPAGKQVISVGVTSPGGASTALSPLPYSQTGQDVSFTVPITEYALVVVSLKDTEQTKK